MYDIIYFNSEISDKLRDNMQSVPASPTNILDTVQRRFALTVGSSPAAGPAAAPLLAPVVVVGPAPSK